MGILKRILLGESAENSCPEHTLTDWSGNSWTIFGTDPVFLDSGKLILSWRGNFGMDVGVVKTQDYYDVDQLYQIMLDSREFLELFTGRKVLAYFKNSGSVSVQLGEKIGCQGLQKKEVQKN